MFRQKKKEIMEEIRADAEFAKIHNVYVGSKQGSVENLSELREVLPINVSASSSNPGFSPAHVLDSDEFGWGSALGDVVGWIQFDFGAPISLRMIKMKTSTSEAQVCKTILQGSHNGEESTPEEFGLDDSRKDATTDMPADTCDDWRNIAVHTWERVDNVWQEIEIEDYILEEVYIYYAI